MTLRGFGEELHATLVRIAAYAGGIAALGLVGMQMFSDPAVEAATGSVRTDWVEAGRPYRAFELTLPEFASPDYAIRRHAGGGRKDILTWGEPDSIGSRLMVEIYRPGKEIKHFAEPTAEISARAVELGAVTKFKAADPIKSKFGEVALASFIATADGRVRSCLGFARAFDDPRLEIAGWHCKGNEEVIAQATIACAIERLALLAAHSEPEVQDLFARAELKRKPCGAKPLALAGNVRRRDWVEAPKPPKLRGRLAGR